MKLLGLLPALFLIFSSLAHAGTRVGNGGGVWVCQESAGPYRSVELVDFFEAQKEYGLKPLVFAESDPAHILDNRYEFIMAHVPELANILALTPRELRALIHFVPDSSDLTIIDDDQVRVKPDPKTCKGGVLYYGQIANYTFDGRLLIAKNFWTDKAFSAVGRAGLLLHEIVYKSLRDLKGDTNSSRARAIVAVIFSNLAVEQMSTRIAKILANPFFVPPNTLPDPFKLVCFGHVESEDQAATPGPEVELATLAATPGILSGKIDRFSFSVTTDVKTSWPTELSISDAETGVRASQNGDTVRASFQNDGKASLSLEVTTAQKLVMLECRAQATAQP